MNYSILRSLCNVQQNGDMDIIISLLHDLENVKTRVGNLNNRTVKRLKGYIDEVTDELGARRFEVEKEEDEEIVDLIYGIDLIADEL